MSLVVGSPVKVSHLVSADLPFAVAISSALCELFAAAAAIEFFLFSRLRTGILVPAGREAGWLIESLDTGGISSTGERTGEIFGLMVTSWYLVLRGQELALYF